MKRLTLIFDCGCSITLWVQGCELRAAEHHCEDHLSVEPPSLLLDWHGLEGKKISTVSIERVDRR